MSYYKEREAATYNKLEATFAMMCPELDFSQMELLPPQVRGVLLWRNSGLKPEERALIASQLKGDWNFQRVTKELRGAWTDEDLRAHDGKVAQTQTPGKRGFHRARSHFQAEAELLFDAQTSQQWNGVLEEALAAAHEELESYDGWAHGYGYHEEDLGYDYYYDEQLQMVLPYDPYEQGGDEEPATEEDLLALQ